MDNFKIINDTFGHDAGDAVLKSVTRNIKQIIRKDDILARRSGDEFLLLAKNISGKKSIKSLAKKVLNAICASIVYQDHDFNISASIGISLFPENSSNIEDLINFADIAMYKAKKDKNSIIFFEE